MKNIKLPYRYDYVGSFLRPDDLKKIRADYEAGKTTYEALKEAEDTAVRDLVAKQKAAGYKLLTDGEFRRKTWYLDFMWGFEGVSHAAPFVFGVEPEKMGDIMDQLLKVNNLALEGKPDDLTVATHICRGNYNSSWASRGGYEPVAERLFAHENVDAYYLEFDDARSGGFEPLRFVTPGKKVVLGLITSKRPELEDKDAVIARIHEAAKYVPLENLCLSPQCGFASCEVGNKLTEEQQWAKLALVKEIAEEVWGK